MTIGTQGADGESVSLYDLIKGNRCTVVLDEPVRVCGKPEPCPEHHDWPYDDIDGDEE